MVKEGKGRHMGKVGAEGSTQPWGRSGVVGVGMGLVHPKSPGDQLGQEHHVPKPIKCSRGHGAATWLPPAHRSEESVLACHLLIPSDPALIPLKTSPGSLQLGAGESRRGEGPGGTVTACGSGAAWGWRQRHVHHSPAPRHAGHDPAAPLLQQSRTVCALSSPSHPLPVPFPFLSCPLGSLGLG